MILVYVSQSGKFIATFDVSYPPTVPSDWIQVPNPPPDHRAYWNFDTQEWYMLLEDIKDDERLWRNNQWPDADIGLFKAQEGASTAVGTTQGWINYKNALRDWPQHANFPDSAYRPQPPTATQSPEPGA